jgi:hypothetical protein
MSTAFDAIFRRFGKSGRIGGEKILFFYRLGLLKRGKVWYDGLT